MKLIKLFLIIFFILLIALIINYKFALKKYSVNVILPGLPKALAENINILESPDGKITLTLKEKKQEENIFYSILVSDTPIFSKTLAKNYKITIPFNSWSPDNKYFILEETTTNVVSNYYLFSSQNKLFPNSLKYLDITEAFSQNIKNYTLKEVTGWASPTLILINTLTPDAKMGPSFWFDVNSQKIIELSTRFN